MGKLQLDFTAFQRRDPVTGELQTLIRDASARQTSEELNVFQECVRRSMEGFKATGETSRERSVSVRRRLSEVAQQCENIDTREQLKNRTSQLSK